MDQSMYIRVVKDLSKPDEAGIAPLIGKTFWGNWIQETKMYCVTDNGLDYYWIKQDECKSACCAFCENVAEENSNICVDCLIEGLNQKESA